MLTRAAGRMVRLAQDRGIRSTAALPMAVLVAGSICVPTAQAAELSATPSVALYSEYNDNLQLSTQPHGSIWSMDLSPRLSLARRTEISEVRLDGRADLRRYFGHSSLDTNDLSLNLSSNYSTELDRWALGARAVRDTVLTGELEASGILVGRRIRRDSYSLSPSWTRQLDAQTSVQLAYSVNDVRYPGSTSYTDYRYQQVNGSVIRQWDAKTQATFTFLGSRFDVPSSQSTSDTLGVQFGVTRNFSETSRGSLTAGWRSTKASGLVTGPVPIPGLPFPDYYMISTYAQSTKSTGALLSASWDKQFERGTATVSLTRNLSPGGFGVLYQTDQLRVSGTRHLAPHIDFTLDFLALRNSAAQGGGSGTDRKYFSIRPGLRWRLTRWWFLDARYQYRRQDYASSATSASGNSVLVSIEYTWPRRSISR